VRYELTPDFEVGFEVRNLFDLKAEDAGPGTDAAFPSDIPLPDAPTIFTVTAGFSGGENAAAAETIPIKSVPPRPRRPSHSNSSA